MAEDLDSVSTLGFRGEALPSIASVARVELRTRTTEPAGQGTSIEIDNGEIVSLGPAGAPYGTTITVRHLFRNLPARRRFLSSTNAEQTRIHRVVAHYAMAYPEVAFELSPERGQVVRQSGERRSEGRSVGGARSAGRGVDAGDYAGRLGRRGYVCQRADRAAVPGPRQPQLHQPVRQQAVGAKPVALVRNRAGVPRLHGGAQIPGRGGQRQRAVPGGGRKRASREGRDQVQTGEQRVRSGAAGRA